MNVYLDNNVFIDIESGNVVGKHIGLMNYTIGQRKGLNIGGFQDKMFVGLSFDAKLLYSLMLDRTSLSIKKRWPMR